MTRLWTIFAAACALGIVLIVLGCRWFGPHDLYEKDQPKTMAYTADVLLNGRYALPRDMIYQPATKPPMYNWIDAAVIGATGVWSEWALKFPSTLGVLVTGGIVFAMTRRAVGGRHDATIAGLLAIGIWFTFGSDVRHASVLRLSYLARPDMLLTAFCTAAWAAFTVAAERPTVRDAVRPAALAWACVLGAVLTKGPAAMLPAFYGIAYAALARGGSRDTLHDEYFVVDRPISDTVTRSMRSWWPVGIGAVLAGGGTWLWLAARQDAVHVREVIWGAEVAGRAFQTPEGFRSPWYASLMWFVTKAWPWGAVAAVGLVLTAWLPRLRRAAGPAALYVTVVLIGLSLPAAKRMDYLLPAFAPAAVLVAVLIADVVRHRLLGLATILTVPAIVVVMLTGKRVAGIDWLVPGVVAVVALGWLAVERRRAVPLGVVMLVPLLLAVLMARMHLRKSIEAMNGWSDDAVRFVHQVRDVLPADAKLLVIVRGKHPLTTLLGRHQGSYLTPTDLAAADYVILPNQPDFPSIVLSRPLPIGFDVVESRELVTLGLYRRIPLDRLVAAQKACAEWTPTENPYRAPGTVFRDE